MVEVELRKWGNSIGAILPMDLLRGLGLEEGDTIDIDIVGKKRVDGFGLCKGTRQFVEEEEPHQELW